MLNASVADLSISDPRFTGDHSYLSISLSTAVRFMTHFSFELKPSSPEGMLLYLGQSRDVRHQDFFSLALRNGSLSLTISLGGPRNRQVDFLVLSLCCARMREWNSVEVGRDGKEGYMKLNGQFTTGISPLSMTTLDVDQTLYLGKFAV